MAEEIVGISGQLGTFCAGFLRAGDLSVPVGYR